MASAISGGPAGTTLGVSIPVPEPHGLELQAKRASFGDKLAECVPAHITLLGPTEVVEEDLAPLVAHLEQAAAEVAPFTVVLRGTGTFRPVSPVVFVQVSDGISACERLEEAIRSGPCDGELPFPYHPHVTIAHDVCDAALDRAYEQMAGYTATFTVHGFYLYEQDVEGTWVPVRRFELAGDGER